MLEFLRETKASNNAFFQVVENLEAGIAFQASIGVCRRATTLCGFTYIGIIPSSIPLYKTCVQSLHSSVLGSSCNYVARYNRDLLQM